MGMVVGRRSQGSNRVPFGLALGAADAAALRQHVRVSVPDPVLSLLDRQVDALANQPSTAEFLVSVEPFLRALEAEPRIAVHLEDLRDETLDRVRVIENEDTELVPKLIALRTSLAKLRPDLDDTDATPRRRRATIATGSTRWRSST